MVEHYGHVAEDIEYEQDRRDILRSVSQVDESRGTSSPFMCSMPRACMRMRSARSWTSATSRSCDSRVYMQLSTAPRSCMRRADERQKSATARCTTTQPMHSRASSPLDHPRILPLPHRHGIETYFPRYRARALRLTGRRHFTPPPLANAHPQRRARTARRRADHKHRRDGRLLAQPVAWRRQLSPAPIRPDRLAHDAPPPAPRGGRVDFGQGARARGVCI